MRSTMTTRSSGSWRPVVFSGVYARRGLLSCPEGGVTASAARLTACRQRRLDRSRKFRCRPVTVIPRSFRESTRLRRARRLAVHAAWSRVVNAILIKLQWRGAPTGDASNGRRHGNRADANTTRNTARLWRCFRRETRRPFRRCVWYCCGSASSAAVECSRPWNVHGETAWKTRQRGAFRNSATTNALHLWQRHKFSAGGKWGYGKGRRGGGGIGVKAGRSRSSAGGGGEEKM